MFKRVDGFKQVHLCARLTGRVTSGPSCFNQLFAAKSQVSASCDETWMVNRWSL